MQHDLAASEAHPSTGAIRSDSFARYLANLLVAGEGYGHGAVEEAAQLAAASDFILTKTDGMSISIVCIVDAEADADRRFGLDRAATLEVAKVCRDKYAGTINGAKMPAVVEIIEVRRSVSDGDLQRLKPIRSRMGSVVTAFAVDVSSSTVNVNAWSLLSPRRRMLERALRQPRRSEGELLPPAPAALPEAEGQPVLTYLLLAIIGGVFVVELLFPMAPMGGPLAPHVSTLVALGGLSPLLVEEQREWFRLFTSAFLHANLFHLVLNGLALWMAGAVLEHLLGRAWLLALFFVGALGGSLLSWAINPSDIVSVGASGAIMGLLAAALVSSFRLPAGGERTEIQMGLARILIPSLIPLAAVRTAGRVDFAGHFGGALVGLLFGGILLATWPRTAPRPRFAGVARALAAAGVLVFASSGYQAMAGYERHALGKLLIPEAQAPRTDEEVVARAGALLKSHPRDPRSHLYGAIASFRAGDARNAEAELRAALAEEEILRTQFKPELEVLLRSLLAEALLAQGRGDDARREAAPVCGSGPGQTTDRLRELGLCPGR